MPYRNRDTLEAWLADFEQQGYAVAGSLRVMPQDGSEGGDTGLIGVRLVSAHTEIYIEPETRDASRWVVTMEPRESAVVLDAAGLLQLSSELATLGALCGYLQTRAQAILHPQA
jgi:hypothetical protein